MDDAEWLFTNALGTAMQRAGARHICKGLGQFRPHLSPLVHSNEGGGGTLFLSRVLPLSARVLMDLRPSGFKGDPTPKAPGPEIGQSPATSASRLRRKQQLRPWLDAGRAVPRGLDVFGSPAPALREDDASSVSVVLMCQVRESSTYSTQCVTGPYNPLLGKGASPEPA